MKMFMFLGFTMFTDGKWDDNMVILEKNEVTKDEVNLPFPIENVVCTVMKKYPENPVEGPNEIEGLIVCENEKMADDLLKCLDCKFENSQEKKSVNFVDMLIEIMDEQEVGEIKEPSFNQHMVEP